MADKSGIPAARTPNRAAAKAPGGRRGISRVTPPIAAPTRPRGSGGMLTGLTAAEAAAEGLKVVDLAPHLLIPHPFNAPSRSELQQDSKKWTELVDGVRTHGVRIAVTAVTRDAFEARWPGLLGDASGNYVLHYGHRRRAAAMATERPTIPVIVDDTLLDEADGGLITMFQENQGREDLDPIAEAELLARFCDDLSLSQRQLGEVLGWNQSTLSRRLSLNLLVPDLRDKVARRTFSPTEAAIIGANLPVGPARSWQRSQDPGQDSAARADQQLRAFELTVNGASAKSAVDRVLAEAASIAEASARGLELVDPVDYFGSDSQARARRSYEPLDGPDAVVALDEQGALAYYRTGAVVAASPTSATHEDETAARTDGDVTSGETERDDVATSAGSGQSPTRPAAGDTSGESAASTPRVPSADKKKDDSRRRATTERSEAAARIAGSPPPRKVLVQILADQFALGVIADAASDAARALARQWAGEPGDLNDADARFEQAWPIALAGFEVHARSREEWTLADSLYLDLLRDRASYQPSAWEREALDRIS